jgi:hypothetical protein
MNKDMNKKKDKDMSLVKVKDLSNIQKVIEKYKEVKGFKDIPNWDKEFYPRFSKSAKALLSLTTLEEAIFCIEPIGIFCDSKDWEWTLETVVKKFPDWKSGNLIKSKIGKNTLNNLTLAEKIRKESQDATARPK